VSGQGGLKIGDNVIVAPMSCIVANEHTFAETDKPIREQPCVASGVTIGRDGWIGVGAVITDGVNVGEHSVVGAGAVVTKDVPPFSVAVGVPARVIREIR
jgi:acetyltransferase-like isoleucine patch superfamily enzyme